MLAAFGEPYGLDRETAFKLGRAFGAGKGLGLTCGAVTGALMVLGFKFGPMEEGEPERRVRYSCYDLARTFMARFQERHGTLGCKELLGGVDLSTEEGTKEARERNLFRTVCPAAVLSAAQILEDLMT